MIPKPILTQISRTIVLSLSIFLLICSYVAYRNLELSLYIANKAIAGAASVVLTLVILSGPLARIYSRLGILLPYRKWLGIVAFGLSYLHMMVTLYFLPSHFPLSRFHLGNSAFVFGAMSTLTLVILFLLSFDRLIGSMDRKLWWSIQNWGVRIAFLFAGTHIILVKYQRWVTWLTEQEAGNLFFYPPAGMVIACFMMYALGLRLIERLGRERAKRYGWLYTIMFVLLVIIVYVFRLVAIWVNR